MTTDEQLIKQIQEGNSEEFGQLFRKYYGQIYSICLSILKNPQDAEEIASDTFISAYLKIDQLSKPDKFFPWLRRIAQNRSKDFLLSKKDTIPLAHSVPTMQVNPDILMLKQELIDAITKAIESLPPKDREVIKARIDGLNHSEISEQLDISISASMNRLYRARKKITAHIKNLLNGIIGLPRMLPFKKIAKGVAELIKVGTSKEVTTCILTATQSLMFSVILHIVLFISLSFFLPYKFHSNEQKGDCGLEVALIPTEELQTMQRPSKGETKSTISVQKSSSKAPRGFLFVKKPVSQGKRGEVIMGINQGMRELQTSTGVSVKSGNRIFSRDRKEKEILQLAVDGPLGGPGGIKTNLSQNQSIPKPSSALPKEDKDIISPTLNVAQSRLTPDIFSSTRDNVESADLNLVFVLARSDLTLEFTLLLKKYISEYIAKIKEQGKLAKQSEYNIAYGTVVYSPANVHGAGIYSISSEKGHLGFLLSELDKIRSNVTFGRYPGREWRGDRRALDGLSVALEKISFQIEAQWRILFVTRNKMGDVLDLRQRGIFRYYCPISSLDDVIEKLRKAKIRVDIVGIDEARTRRLARETGGSFSDVRLLETGELRP